MSERISRIEAREIISAGSFPTIEATVVLEDGYAGDASVPFGSSAGAYEAVTLVDGDPARYHGLGMLKAIAHIHERIAPELCSSSLSTQAQVDKLMVEMDGTPDKSNLGGNAMLSVSLAYARAVANSRNLELFQYLEGIGGYSNEKVSLPIPMMVAIEGGRHADQSTDFQEYMILPVAKTTARETVRLGIEVYQALRNVLKRNKYAVNVGYEGAYAPTNWGSNEEPLRLMVQAIRDMGYAERDEIALGLDPAASEFYDKSKGVYVLTREERSLGTDEMISYYESLMSKYPIISIEDGLSEDDWEGWARLTESLGDQCTIVGDDLTVTQVARIDRAIAENSINAVLIKPNQCGTLSETLAAIRATRNAGFKTAISHRGGGETNDTLIVDLAFATRANLMKVGSSRGERVCKYNRYMEIAETLGL